MRRGWGPLHLGPMGPGCAPRAASKAPSPRLQLQLGMQAQLVTGKTSRAHFIKSKSLSCSVVSGSLLHHGVFRQAPGPWTSPTGTLGGWPFPLPGSLPSLPDLGMEPWSPALQVESLPSEPPAKPQFIEDSLISDLRFHPP